MPGEDSLAMQYETILVDVADHVATITLNRPEAMNSFTRQMMTEFEYLWKWIARTDDIHCCVLRAAPGKAWCTGVDVKESQKPGQAVVELDNIWHCEDPGNTLGPKSMNCWKPVIAAVHGMAAGGRSEEHTSELQSLMRISYAVFCLKKKKKHASATTR